MKELEFNEEKLIIGFCQKGVSFGIETNVWKIFEMKGWNVEVMVMVMVMVEGLDYHRLP